MNYRDIKKIIEYPRNWLFLLIIFFSSGPFLFQNNPNGILYDILLHSGLICFLLIVVDIFLKYYKSESSILFLKGNFHDFFFLILMLLYWEKNFSFFQIVIIRQVIVIIKSSIFSGNIIALFEKYQRTPAKLMLFSFALVIFCGTAILSMPISSSSEKSIDTVDALFTSASAVCVTGLIVKDTPVDFSLFGKTVILILIQFGGIGIMTISTFLTLLVGRKLGVRERVTLEALISEEGIIDIVKILQFIVKMTIIIELVGAMFLTFRFYGMFGSWLKSIYYGLFHSVSAFCNAGFALFSNSFEGFYNDWAIVLIITTLIHLGSLGFTVIYALIVSRFYLGTEKMKKYRFSIHFKLAITMTLILTFGGTFFILITEYTNSFINMSFSEKLLASYFQSVTLRTAGFNTVSLPALQDATIIFMFFAMFIGACPRSTGGGVKTTTVGVMFLTVFSMLRDRKSVEYKDRRIPQRIVKEAIAIVTISFMIIVVFSILLSITENFSMKEVVYETISAFATVGLSLGITAELSFLGKILVTLLMYIGRVGPLTVAFALGQNSDVEEYTLMKGNIVVG